MLAYFKPLEILATEEIYLKVCSIFNEKYGISSADINTVQIV